MRRFAGVASVALLFAVGPLGAATPPRFLDPEGIALDGGGGLLVSDLHGKRIFRVATATGAKKVVATTPTAAIDVAVVRGTTYVLGEQRLYRLDGPRLTQLPIELPLTFAIAPAPQGRLALADIGNSAVQLL